MSKRKKTKKQMERMLDTWTTQQIEEAAALTRELGEAMREEFLAEEAIPEAQARKSRATHRVLEAQKAIRKFNDRMSPPITED